MRHAVGQSGESTPSHQAERSFGIAVGITCLLVTGLSWWRHPRAWVPVMGVVGMVLLLGGLVCPARLRGPRLVWERLAHGMGWINTRIVLGVVFVGVVTPMGWCLRWVGWDPLRRRGRPGESTWTPYPERHRDPNHFERTY